MGTRLSFLENQKNLFLALKAYTTNLFMTTQAQFIRVEKTTRKGEEKNPGTEDPHQSREEIYMQTAEALKLEEIEAVVGKVIYRDPQTKIPRIASMKTENLPKFAQNWKYPNSFMALGNLGVAEKQRFRLFGKWQKDKTYGWQFIVDHFEEVIPETRDGLKEYLSSGLFKGIGEKTAEAIIDHFGKETLNVIKTNPRRLAEVKGISSNKANAIAESYKQSEHLEKLMMLLTPFHITTGKIVKIYHKYEGQAMDIIRKNPYQLCEDVEGIGFKIADKIARSVGINAGDDYRIRAGLVYTLSEAGSSEGHVYLPFDDLIGRAKRVLENSEVSGDVERNDIVRVAIDMGNKEELINENGNVYLPIYHASEVYAGRKLGVLRNHQPKRFTIPFDKIIPEMEQKFGLKRGYAAKQKEAFKILANGNVAVVTGGPGTGKTTIVKGIIEIFKQNFKGCKISLCAPTGRAAKRMEEATKMEGKTMHRLLEYRPSGDEGVTCNRNEKNPFDADVVICDEFSMVDILLFSTFLKAIKPGTTLIIVGDVDQLPSVGAGSVLKDIINSGKVPTVRLSEIHRQADTSKIIINAAKIKDGDTDLEWDENFVFIECQPDEIPAMMKEQFMQSFGELRDVFEVQALSPFRKKTDAGSDALNVLLQDAMNPNKSGANEVKFGKQVFRKHDKVMQFKNNYEKEIYNGDVGLVHAIHGETDLSVMIEQEEVTYDKDGLTELGLAYCTTIHKSQGCEYHTVIIPLTFAHRIMLQRNLIYTGVTRAKVRVILVGERKALNYAIKNNRIAQRFSNLQNRIA